MITLKQISVEIEVLLAVKTIKSKETRREFSFLTRTFCFTILVAKRSKCG